MSETPSESAAKPSESAAEFSKTAALFLKIPALPDKGIAFSQNKTRQHHIANEENRFYLM